MDISELFEKIQEEFQEEELRGEFVLQGNLIIWSYNLNDDMEECGCLEDEDEDCIFNYESECSEEQLIEVYREDLEKTKLFLDELEEIEDWTFSDYEIVDDVILFKVF